MVTTADSSWLRSFAGTAGAPATTRQLKEALELLGYDFGYEEQRVHALRYLADFTARWGKLSLDSLLAVAHRFVPLDPVLDVDAAVMRNVVLLEPKTPEEVDVLFALATLGKLRAPEAPSLLLHYLASSHAQERWLAAFGLAAMHDERVLPTLGRMLVEFMGPNQPQRSDGTIVYRFQLWRADLPRMLADWGNAQVVPLLRTALIATVRAEAIELQEPHGPEQVFASRGRRLVGEQAWELFHYERREWAEDEHRLVYALGRLGAFGALVGVPTRRGIYYYYLPSITYIGDETGENPVEVEDSDPSDRVAESRADVFQGAIWRVHACCGFLESQFRDRLNWVYAFYGAPELAEAIERLLEGQFGWDAAERRQAMEDYERASFLTGIVADYEQFARQAQEETGNETEHT